VEVEVVVRVLAAQAREPGVVVRALPAEPVRPQPEELTRDQALGASARAEDPPTPGGRVTPTLIGPRRESSLRRDRGIRGPLLELTGRRRPARPGICRATPTNSGSGPYPPLWRHRSKRIRLVRHACGCTSTRARSIGFTCRQPHQASDSLPSTRCRSQATNRASVRRSSARRARAALPLDGARAGRGLQPRQMPASPVRCAAHGVIASGAARTPGGCSSITPLASSPIGAGLQPS
jgi:hypothetical protein